MTDEGSSRKRVRSESEDGDGTVVAETKAVLLFPGKYGETLDCHGVCGWRVVVLSETDGFGTEFRDFVNRSNSWDPCEKREILRSSHVLAKMLLTKQWADEKDTLFSLPVLELFLCDGDMDTNGTLVTGVMKELLAGCADSLDADFCEALTDFGLEGSEEKRAAFLTLPLAIPKPNIVAQLFCSVDYV
jgi:hypothetical protein